MRRLLPILVAAAVLAAGWLILGQPTAAPNPTPEAGLPGGGTGPPTPPAAGAAPIRPEGAEERRPGPVAGGLVLRAVEAETGRPVADCPLRVFELGEAAPPELAEALRAGGWAGEAASRLGLPARTDREGRLAWATAARPLVFVAQAPWSGLARWGPGDPSELELRLRPRRELEVLVLDAAGGPAAEVPVLLAVRPLPAGGSGYRAVSGPDGVARFPDFGDFLASALPAEAEQAWLAADLAAPERDWRSFAARPPPTAPIELRLPPAGEVVVRVLGDAGRARQCTLAPAREPGRPFRPFAGPTRPVRNGEARFRWVPLGRRFLATVDLAGEEEPARVEGPGPARPGEVRELLIDLTAGTILAGRLLDSVGRPVPPGDWTWTLVARGGGRKTGGLRSTEDGGFRIRVSEEAAAWELTALELRPRAVGLSSGGDGRLARTGLTGPLAPGIHDLGDLTVVEPPLLVAGRAVGASGEPLEGVVVEVERELPGGEDLGGTWQAVPEWRRLTGRDGAFAVRAEFGDPVGLRLRAHKVGWFLPEPVPFRPGRADLQLRLEAGGGLRVPVLVPSGAAAGDLAVWAVGPDGRPRSWPGRLTAVEPERLEAGWTGLPPGRWGVRLGLRTAGEPLLEQEAGSVRAGETCTAPPADLRELLRVVVLEVTAPDGTGLAHEARVIRLGRDGPRPAGFRLQDEWRLRATVAAGAPLDLIVRAEGRRPVRLEGVAGTARVRLEPLVPTRLILPSPLPTGPEGSRLTVSLQRRTGALDPWPGLPARIRLEGDLVAGGEILAWLEAPGDYRLQWTFSCMREGREVVVGSRFADLAVAAVDLGGRLVLPAPEGP
ncbi:MAG: hypothetical protein D6702_06265 [Planctomycetota bacterium]|nr:MAG: hypothetical protein D6702_06265 [Planctomycetota bacterium]